MNLNRIGNIQKMHTDAHSMSSRLKQKNGNTLIYNIYSKKILDLILNFNEIMKRNHFWMDFLNYDYELYELKNCYEFYRNYEINEINEITNMYFIKVKFKQASNNNEYTSQSSASMIFVFHNEMMYIC
jgi:hypothetical protein